MKIRRKRNRKEDLSTPPPVQPPRLTKMLDIPQSAFSSMPQLELSGNREAIVEGCQGILEYDENVVKLATGKMTIKFSGRDLQIKVLTHSSAIVDGFITAIEFGT